jgi:amino acid adenylation domain-containing protein
MGTGRVRSAPAAREQALSLAALVATQAAERPRAIAVEDGERHLTYAELDAAAAAIANSLRERGAGAEEPVAVCAPRSWRSVCATLGAVRAGAAYVPIGDAYPPRRKRQLLELTGARFVLTDGATELGLPDDRTLLDVEALVAQGGDAEIPAGGERLAYVVFTSGSTGRPKGVEITHANLLHLLKSGSDLLPRPGDTVLAVAPTEFDIAALEHWGALAAGARLVLAPPGRPDPQVLGRLITERGVSFAFFAAGLFEQVVRSALVDLGGMRLIAAGGDVMSPAAARALRDTHPEVRVINAYGPTETSIVATAFEVDEVGDAPLPIGRPLLGYELHVLDEEGAPVAPGEPGELWIGGPGVARGYRGEERLTRDRFRRDRFAASPEARMYGSGDLVRLREDGELMFLGRLDHQVKISGYRVEPGEVEQVLGSHPALAQAAVVAREDVAGHKRLLACAVPRSGATVSSAELREHLAERLPHYMLPAAIELLAELPLTERGKIDRASLPSPTPSAAGAAGGREAEVARMMAELLGLPSVGPEDDFFALGADSLLAIQLVGQLRDRFGADLEITAVFESPSPRRLAARLEAPAGPARPPLARSALGAGPAPATFAQRRSWLFERINPGSLAYQFAAVLHLTGELNEAALRGALADLMARHPALRTALRARDDEPVQVVEREVEVPLETVDLSGAGGAEWARFLRGRVRTRIPLERAPLVRWTLARRGPRSWSLIDLEHHAVHDGWSFMVVLSELAELYSSRVEDRPPRLPKLGLDLGDFARWERSRVDGELERRQLDYWRRTLDPDPPLLELPTCRPRPARESFRGGSVRRRVPRGLAAGARELAREEGATAFMAGLAAFAALLGRSAGVDSVQIGSGLANRADRAAERLVGMTVGTVALRVDLSGDPTVRELLRRTRTTVLNAIANSDVPFERVVDALAPRRLATRSPLLQTLFSFDDAPARESRWSGLDVRVVQTLSNGSAKADLNVIGVDHGDGDPFYIWEHSELFSDADADRLAGQHLGLLERFVADPDARLSELSLSDAEEGARLADWSRGEGEFDREATIPALLARQAARDPDAPAVLDGEERLSYGELVERARAVAGALRRRGVGRGDLVAVLLPRSVHSAVACLGVLEAGAAYLPLDPAHPAARIGRSLADAGAALAIAAPDLASLLPAGMRWLAPEDAAAEPPLEPQPVGPEDLAYVMYTSGSTGSPKGVEVTHRNVVRLLDAPAFADLGPGTTMLHAASPAFDATTLELWGPLANGGTVAVLSEQPTPDAVAAAVAAHGVTTMWLTAGLFHELVDRRPECLGSVRQVLAGGDVLSPDHVARALAALPADGRLTNGYGPTETTTFALTHELRPGDEVGAVVPLGRPVQGTTCEVLDGAGQRAPIGVAGELWIGGEGVARGYRGDPRLTAARFLPDPGRPGGRRYRSGDRVRRRPDGTLEFLGRLDRQLKIRGVRVEPAEVERALRQHGGVADATVLPYERAPGDRALAAYVVPAEVGAPPDSLALREHAVARLPAAMVPSAYIPLDSLPLNANGKVDRERLPAPTDVHLARRDGAQREPRNGRERRVVAVFEDVLGLEGVGAEDDFFALGGHSLLAVALFAELERATGTRLPLATIFEAPTPRQLAARLGPGVPAPNWGSLVALKPGGGRPPLFAVTAGDGNVVGFGPLAQHVSAEQPLYALQPRGLDGFSAVDRGIGAMAERCIEEIRGVQPRGPYLLAGRCNGATVAYEIGQRLRQAGDEVPLLVALDSAPPFAGPLELEAGVRSDILSELAWLRAWDAGEEPPPRDGAGTGAALASWLRGEVGPGISRYSHEAWHLRADLRRRWPDPLGADAAAYVKWLWEDGVREHEMPLQLVSPAPHGACRLPDGQRWDWAIAAAWDAFGRLPENPLGRRGWAQLRQRLLEPVGGGGANRYLLAAASRPDLAAAFANPLDGDLPGLLAWAWSAGLDEGLSATLLPPPRGPLSRAVRLRLATTPARRRVERLERPDWASLAERLARQRDRAAGRTEALLRRPLPGSRGRLEGRIVDAARRARDKYRAAPWPGRIVLVTSAEHGDKLEYAGWAERAAELDRRPLPLGHVEMLREPGAALLARCLEDCIAEALQGDFGSMNSNGPMVFTGLNSPNT